MGYGNHKVPDPLQDEDKWFGATKPQLIVVAVVVVIVLFILKITFELSILLVGVFLSVSILIFSGALILLEIPDDKYLLGSGTKVWKVIFRITVKKTPAKKKLYTKNLANGFEKWKEK